jgi:hypothetical protein
MISDATMRRALGCIALLKYFPAGNAEALTAVAEMISELYTEDAHVEGAISKLLHDPDMAEWPGAGVFFEWLKCAIHPRGMMQLDGRWVPRPERSPDGIDPNAEWIPPWER